MEKKEENQDIILESVVSLLKYSERINGCTDSGDLVLISDLYLRLEDKNTDEDIVQTISDYISMFYLNIEHFQERELFESCEILNKAMNKELTLIMKYVLKDYDSSFRKNIMFINESLKNYYLGD